MIVFGFAGGLDSDTATEMSSMRVNILPIVEAAGADVIVGGHSHNYERSQVWLFLMAPSPHRGVPKFWAS